ncbi:MAG: DUF4157 domain-containing protein [Rhodobacteraceae bacterium]|nr:DUF4157 domain-containing protein [Paracoccaceae bacterium]
MALKRKIRRKIRRKSPSVRRRSDAGLTKAKSETSDSSGPLIGGAHDPAEKTADQKAAQVLGSNASSVRRSTTSTAIAPGATPAPAPKHAALAISSLGGGRKMNRGERAFFEPRFNRDFGNVRVHDGETADTASRSIDAQAFANGDDIAFARDRLNRRTMAHELAHIAETPGPKIHRYIQPGSEMSADITHTLETDYGASGVHSKGHLLSVSSSSGTSDSRTEIVETMLGSQRVFTLKGSTRSEVEDSLGTHVNARLSTIDYAKSIRLGFTTGTPKVDEAKWKVFDDEYDKVEAELDKNLKDQGLSEAERAAQLKSAVLLIMITAMNNQVGTTELNDLLDDISLKSKAYDAAKDPSKARPYAMACFRASLVVMAGGSRSKLSVSFLDGIPGTKDKMDAMTWDDWIPGDWGYISNQGAGTIKAGQEGENIVSLGQGKFWAHYDPDTPIQTLTVLFDMVEGWNGKAQLETQRTIPTAGLV